MSQTRAEMSLSEPKRLSESPEARSKDSVELGEPGKTHVKS